MKPYYISQVELCTISGLSAQTVRACVKGKNIEYENAQSIYKAFIKMLNDKDKIAYTNGIRSRKRKPEPPITKVPKYNFSDLFEVVDSKKTLSGKTVWEYHQFLYSVFSLAMTERIIKYNPAASAESPKYNTPEQDVFEIEEIQQIVKTLYEEYINGRVSAKWRAIMKIPLT